LGDLPYPNLSLSQLLTYKRKDYFQIRKGGLRLLKIKSLIILQKKKLGSSHKRRRKKAPRRDRYITSFTTAEALTYLLKGWTEDLIDIGAPESLKATVKLMWMKYLSKIGISIEAEKVESKISNAPTFRDLQVRYLSS